MTPSPKSITQLLIEWREGDESALDQLMPLVYNELRRMAHHYMRGERPGHTLQTSDLVNELYLRLVDHNGMQWQNRAHFYAVAAQAMRRILIDEARKRRALKRRVDFVDLDPAVPIVIPEKNTDLLAVDEAITELEKFDPRKAKIVVMKHYGGMTDKDIAKALGISTATVSRELKAAKMHLLQILTHKSK